MQTVRVIIAYLMSLFQVVSPVFATVFAGGEGAFFTEWSVTDEFTAEDYITIQKDPEKDFVILNLADVQMKDDEIFTAEADETFALIDALVEEHEPDLITLSGDNGWAMISYIELIKKVDSYGIPWAPVMGNHDGQGCVNEFWAAYLMYKADNCLFEFGPKDMGYGNYIINITENGRIVHTLFMVDTHNSSTYTLSDGTQISGYDHLWKNQMEWYEWAVNGIKEIEGRTVESTVIMHIPVVEYDDAWKLVYNEETGSFRPGADLIASGSKFEGVSSAPVNNGFFALCKELGSTKTMLCGHDHVNDFSILYQGIRLVYAVKTGYCSYYNSNLMGATTVSINSFGEASVHQNYVDEVPEDLVNV